MYTWFSHDHTQPHTHTFFILFIRWLSSGRGMLHRDKRGPRVDAELDQTQSRRLDEIQVHGTGGMQGNLDYNGRGIDTAHLVHTRYLAGVPDTMASSHRASGAGP